MLAEFYSKKNVLVTGGTGMIGVPLVHKLLKFGANVTVASLDDPKRCPEGANFLKADLREFSNCMSVCRDMQVVFHLAGVKGSPAMTAKRPASFFVPTTSFNTNMMEAARRSKVDNYLFTSSVGVYAPADVFFEDSVWSTFPSPNDKFAGWAKRMGELQAEAYQIEYGWDKITIVRPANVYGPFDNFDHKTAMVIPSLIARAFGGETPLKVWGDGSAIRDFIFSHDVADGMLTLVAQGVNQPVNLGSGTGVSIKEIAEKICELAPNGPIPIEWDTTKPSGDKQRILSDDRAISYGFQPQTSLHSGIDQTIKWYGKNLSEVQNRYIAFDDAQMKA